MQTEKQILFTPFVCPAPWKNNQNQNDLYFKDPLFHKALTPALSHFEIPMRSDVIHYLRTCYQSDNRHQSLWDIFQKNTDTLHFIDDSDFQILRKSASVIIPTQYAKQLLKLVDTYRREKRLVLCCYLLCGRLPKQDSDENCESEEDSPPAARKIIAPLVFCNATCKLDSTKYRINVDLDEMEWNVPLLHQLMPDAETVNAFLTKAHELSFLDNPKALVETLTKLSHTKIGITSQAITTSEEAQAISKAQQPHKDLVLSPTISIAMIDRGLGSRGILDELKNMASSKKSSAPLLALDSKSNKNRGVKSGKLFHFGSKKANTDNVPGLLSDAQKTILTIAAQESLGVVIGPPGTGKSYTIGAVALDRFMAGESVLIVSNTEYAVDVIREKLITQFGLSQDAVIRAGVKNYHKELKQHLDNIKKGLATQNHLTNRFGEFKKVHRSIDKLEVQLAKQLDQSESDGATVSTLLDQGDIGFLDRLKLWRIKSRATGDNLLHEILDELQKLHQQREKVLAQHIDNQLKRRIKKMLRKNRKVFTYFRQAIGARTSKKQDEVFAQINFPRLLESLPIWLCSLESLHKVLPLEPELFDLVVFDEATQCDIASGLPALFRASRALIFGDPQQLRHVSFLSRDRQQQLAETLGLPEPPFSYRDQSMIDIADQKIISQDSVCMLDEHFRSRPDIIQFSNTHFYDDRLRIMTEKPGRLDQQAVSLKLVTHAERIEGVNRIEADSLINDLKTLIDEQAAIPIQYKLSIGIVSFFRDQAEFLQDRLFDEIPLEQIQHHSIRAGTPYAFQGEERDIILLSCAVDSESPSGSFTYLNRQDVFNVAITRAREKQIVYHSLTMNQLPQKNLLRQYVEFVGQYKKPMPTVDLDRQATLQELTQIFLGLGIQTIHGYPIAGFELDLVLQKDGEVVAIDLLGFPHCPVQEVDIYRYHIFERAGLRILPVAFTSWREKREAVIERINQEFVRQKEQNTAARLSINDFRHHWTKLLAFKPALARTVRIIEADLITQQLPHAVAQLGQIIDQQQLVDMVLKEKLHPTELTFIRYRNAAEQILLNGLDHFSQITLLQKSLLETATPQNRELQQQKIDSLQTEIGEAIQQLEELALKWSNTHTKEGVSGMTMDNALSELGELITKVDLYDSNDDST